MQLGECEEGAKAISELFKNESGVASHTRTWSFEFDQSVKRVIDIQMLFVLSSFPLLLFSSVPFFNLPRFFSARIGNSKRFHYYSEHVCCCCCTTRLSRGLFVSEGGGDPKREDAWKAKAFLVIGIPNLLRDLFPSRDVPE